MNLRLPKIFKYFSRSNPVGELASVLVACLFGALLQMVLKKLWQSALGREAPLNPSQPGVKWGEALTWGVATGAAAGIVKVVARRTTDLAQQRLAK